MSKKYSPSFLQKKIGFFCYRCGHDDFGNNQKSLSAHVQYCSFNPYSNSQSKRKSDNQPIGLHSSDYFLGQEDLCFEKDSFELADLHQHESNNYYACLNSEYFIFDAGRADPSTEDDHTANVDVFNHQAAVSDGTNMIHQSMSTSVDDEIIPYNPNCSLPPSYQFQLDHLSTLSKHRINLNL
jgi:hypothetical protein